MVKIDKQAQQTNHAALLAAASTAIRQGGIAAVSVQDIAAKAGLTHGAVYRHFDSKAAMAAQIITRDFDKIVEILGQMQAAADPYATYVTTYLDAAHRDHFPWGCPAAPLAAEISRLEPEIQTAFVQGLARNLDALAALIVAPDAQEQAKVALSLMSGAMSLARACKASDPAMSDSILAVARLHLLRNRPGAPVAGADKSK